MAGKVISQTPQSGQYPDGHYGPGVLVVGQLDSGTQVHVFIPAPQYTPAGVQAALTEAAAAASAVDGLTF